MKYAIVTGGTKGIGKEICRKLLGQDFSVISVYKNDDVSAELTKKEFEKEFHASFYLIKCDLSNSDHISDLYDEVSLITGCIDVLILNAGKTIRQGLAEMRVEDWESVMAVNVTTPLFLIQRLLPLLTKGASIIFTGSLMAEYPHSVSLSYGVTKAAVHAMVKNLVKFLIPYHIRINCVSPGFVDTEWQKDKPPAIRESITNKLALQRFAYPEEVASVYLYIIGNPYLNGEIFTISGGYSYQ